MSLLRPNKEGSEKHKYKEKTIFCKYNKPFKVWSERK